MTTSAVCIDNVNKPYRVLCRFQCQVMKKNWRNNEITSHHNVFWIMMPMPQNGINCQATIYQYQYNAWFGYNEKNPLGGHYGY